MNVVGFFTTIIVLTFTADQPKVGKEMNILHESLKILNLLGVE